MNPKQKHEMVFLNMAYKLKDNGPFAHIICERLNEGWTILRTDMAGNAIVYILKSPLLRINKKRH